MTTDELDVVVAFRRQLAEAPEPRRTRPALGAGAVALAVAIPTVAVLAAGDGTSSALAVSRGSGVLELRIADASADADELTRELNEAGVPGRVLVVPVAPEQVGRWVVTAEIAGRRATCIPSGRLGTGPEETVRLGAIRNGGATLSVPVERVRESSGSFVLVAGRAARDGEQPLAVEQPDVVQRDILGPVLGPPPERLPAC